MNTFAMLVVCVISYLSMTFGWGLQPINLWWMGAPYLILLISGLARDIKDTM